MRFDYLNLRAFGHFTDYEISFDPSKNFHLLYGPNEAGKSTTLRSITDFLYGFPQKTNDSFLHSNSKLRIEGQIKNSKGEALQFIRRKGRKDTVLDLNGSPINEKIVQDFIQGMPQSQFTNMFALDHVRLREGGESLLQSNGSAGESVFSAASGINLLRNILEKFDKEAGDLYKKTGSNPALNKLLSQEKELNSQLQKYQLNVKEWKELEREYLENGKQIQELKRQIRELHTQQEKLERVKRMLPKLAKQKDLLQKLQELANVPNLPDDIKDIRISAENQLHGAIIDKEKIENDLKEIQEQLQDIFIPTKVLEQEAVIDSLYREVQSYQKQLQTVPELQGKKKQLEALVISIMKEIDAVHAGLENIDKYRIPAAIKASIRELAKDKPLLDEKLEGINREFSKLEKELEKKQSEASTLPELSNVNELESIIDKVKRDGLEQSLKTLNIEINDKEQLINDGVHQLDGWSGSYEELLNLQVPTLQETLKRFEKEYSDIQQQLLKVQDQITQQTEAMETYQESIRQIDSLVEIPSVDDLQRARSSRDDGWKLIRIKLQTGNWSEKIADYRNGQAIEEVYEAFVRDADQKADTMRLEAENVSYKSRLKSDIESSQNKITDLKVQEQSLKEEFENWKKNWVELWKHANIDPLSPNEMKEWLQKFHQIKALVIEWMKLTADKKEKEANQENSKQTLISALSKFTKVSNEQTLDELITIADMQLKQMREIESQKMSLIRSIRETEEKMKQDKLNKGEILQKLDIWKNKWKEVIAQTNLPEEISTTVAEKMLEKYDECVFTYEQFKVVEEEEYQLQQQILFFEDRVRDVFEHVGNPFDGSNVDSAVTKLYSELQKGKGDYLNKSNLLNQQKRLQSNCKDAIDRQSEAEQILSELYKTAKCETIDELREIERLYLLKKEYRTRIRQVEEDMLEQGNGKSLHELMEEANSFDSDNIEVELEEVIKEREDLENELNHVNQNYGIIRKEYEEKIKGNNYASIHAQQEKESIHAQIASLTDQYIQLKLASILLQKGIEYYRNQNQNPIIRRASEIFARLTLQSFVGLTVDYDEKDQPVLMGVRENNEKVSIDGMSDGTTDQLYLSLRIASIERYVDENEPIPFIVDDILVHFDDTRSKETLSILLELSKHTQIIFFTHHARLIDIMNAISQDEEYQSIQINHNDVVLFN
ncbi:AAA family ATPase [Niallia sp. Krafla_26]|uniref:AAA family ATPase n=1 Tax=Niallia sp. Krafla_26 TaxID=3064703 RepID=UPI003D181344